MAQAGHPPMLLGSSRGRTAYGRLTRAHTHVLNATAFWTFN
jgi:hypothetical protein